MPSQHGGAEQLGAAGLLLGPGVADHEEHHHQADAELGDLRDLVGDDAADGVDRGLPAGHQIAHGAGADGAGVAGDLLRGVVERRDGQRADRDGPAEADQPQRQPDPVPAQDQADQVAGPGRTARSRGHLFAVLAQEELLQRRRVRDQGADAERRRAPDRGVEVVGVDVERDPAVEELAGRARPRRPRSVAGGAVSAMTVVRVRWRSSASEPALHDPARPDDADPVGQGLGLGEDVAELSSTVAPSCFSSSTAFWNSASISGSSPEVGSSSRKSSARLASAATRATFWRLPLE